MTSENELTELLPEGSGNFYADGAYDSKKVLNTVVERGYRPIVKKTKNPRVVLAVRRGMKCFLMRSISTGILRRGSGVLLPGLVTGCIVF